MNIEVNNMKFVYLNIIWLILLFLLPIILTINNIWLYVITTLIMIFTCRSLYKSIFKSE